MATLRRVRLRGNVLYMCSAPQSTLGRSVFANSFASTRHRPSVGRHANKNCARSGVRLSHHCCGEACSCSLSATEVPTSRSAPSSWREATPLQLFSYTKATHVSQRQLSAHALRTASLSVEVRSRGACLSRKPPATCVQRVAMGMCGYVYMAAREHARVYYVCKRVYIFLHRRRPG